MEYELHEMARLACNGKLGNLKGTYTSLIMNQNRMREVIVTQSSSSWKE